MQPYGTWEEIRGETSGLGNLALLSTSIVARFLHSYSRLKHDREIRSQHLPAIVNATHPYQFWRNFGANSCRILLNGDLHGSIL